MRRVLVIARDSESKAELRKNLSGPGLACSFTSLNNGVREAVAGARPDVILFEAHGQQPGTPELIKKLKNSENLPVIELVPEGLLGRTDYSPDADDFLAAPY